MSTRGVIAVRKEDGGFEGRFHHFDSYPSGLGKALYKLYRVRYNKNLESMIKELIQDHPAGWRSILDDLECYCHNREKLFDRLTTSIFRFTAFSSYKN